MSQEKVDRYKKEKANREKIMRRERWITRLEVTAFVVVLAALIGWFSVAVYQADCSCPIIALACINMALRKSIFVSRKQKCGLRGACCLNAVRIGFE